jgi:hypothetical protein
MQRGKATEEETARGQDARGTQGRDALATPGARPLPVFGEEHDLTPKDAAAAAAEEEEEEVETARGRDALATRGQDARDTQGRDALATVDAAEEGAATLEFALVLPIALMIVLVMIQASLLMGGNLCTHYAAFCAARSAIVNVPRNFADEPPNIVGDAASSSKVRRIQMAAVWAVMPVSCTQKDGPSVNASNLQDALSAVFAGGAGGAPGWINQDMGRRLAYAQDHTTVEMDPPTGQAPPGAGPINPLPPKNGAYAPGEDLRIRVKHDFYLSVPYAARIFSQVTGDGMQLDFGQGQYALTIRADCTLTNEGEQDFVDVENFP